MNRTHQKDQQHDSHNYIENKHLIQSTTSNPQLNRQVRYGRNRAKGHCRLSSWGAPKSHTIERACPAKGHKIPRGQECSLPMTRAKTNRPAEANTFQFFTVLQPTQSKGEGARLGRAKLENNSSTARRLTNSDSLIRHNDNPNSITKGNTSILASASCPKT